MHRKSFTYVCIYECTCAYVECVKCWCIHTHIQWFTSICLRVCTCMRICIFAIYLCNVYFYLEELAYSDMQLSILIYTDTHSHRKKHTNIHTYICIQSLGEPTKLANPGCKCIHTNTFMHLYIHMHTVLMYILYSNIHIYIHVYLYKLEEPKS